MTDDSSIITLAHQPATKPKDPKAIVLFTGGKDSTLAYHEAVKEGYEVVRAVTFGSGHGFRAHPVEVRRRKKRQGMGEGGVYHHHQRYQFDGGMVMGVMDAASLSYAAFRLSALVSPTRWSRSSWPRESRGHLAT